MLYGACAWAERRQRALPSAQRAGENVLERCLEERACGPCRVYRFAKACA